MTQQTENITQPTGICETPEMRQTARQGTVTHQTGNAYQTDTGTHQTGDVTHQTGDVTRQTGDVTNQTGSCDTPGRGLSQFRLGCASG